MITITIDTSNSAFDHTGDDPQTDNYSREVLRILQGADFYSGGPLKDINGNTVGNVVVSNE